MTKGGGWLFFESLAFAGEPGLELTGEETGVFGVGEEGFDGFFEVDIAVGGLEEEDFAGTQFVFEVVADFEGIV